MRNDLDDTRDAAEPESGRGTSESATGMIEGASFFAQPVTFEVIDGRAILKVTLSWEQSLNSKLSPSGGPDLARRSVSGQWW